MKDKKQKERGKEGVVSKVATKSLQDMISNLNQSTKHFLNRVFMQRLFKLFD